VLAKYASQVFDTSTPINTWIDLDVTHQTYPTTGVTNQMHAPPGTIRARFDVTFTQQLYDWGSIYFDEAKLEEIVPPVLVPPLLGAALNGAGEIEISFPTQAGVNYQVLSKGELTENGWNTVETIPGDGTTKSVSYPVEAGWRFYAVQLF
jgi:hypothetical protein